MASGHRRKYDNEEREDARKILTGKFICIIHFFVVKKEASKGAERRKQPPDADPS